MKVTRGWEKVFATQTSDKRLHLEHTASASETTGQREPESGPLTWHRRAWTRTDAFTSKRMRNKTVAADCNGAYTERHWPPASGEGAQDGDTLGRAWGHSRFGKPFGGCPPTPRPHDPVTSPPGALNSAHTWLFTAASVGTTPGRKQPGGLPAGGRRQPLWCAPTRHRGRADHGGTRPRGRSSPL